MTAPAYRRILLKLSGEALMGDDAFGINRDVVSRIVQEVAEVVSLGVEVGVVIGGGNIFRGMAGAASGMDRATADYMGMLATVMNAMALADAMKACRRRCTRSIRARDGSGGGALHQGQGHSLSRGWQGRNFRGGHGGIRSLPRILQLRCAAPRLVPRSC